MIAIVETVMAIPGLLKWMAIGLIVIACVTFAVHYGQRTEIDHQSKIESKINDKADDARNSVSNLSDSNVSVRLHSYQN